jgi:hypothetical protein
MKHFSWRALSWATVAIAVIAIWSCTDNNVGSPDDLASGSKKGGGNEECTVGEFSTGRINYNPSTGEWTDQAGNLVDFGLLGFKVIVSDDGRSFTWSANPGICVRQVIVKGGTGATVVTYDGTATSGGPIVSPRVGNDRTPQISNVTICYDKCGDKCYNYETAFGGDESGAGSAWWFYFDPTKGATQTIYAGQNATNGSVTLADGVFTIDLGSWELSAVKESVKIGGYDVLPAKRPAAGQFEKSGGTTIYKGESLVVSPVGTFNYYVVHLDVKQEIACPQ